MQIVSFKNNLHEMLNPTFSWEKPRTKPISVGDILHESSNPIFWKMKFVVWVFFVCVFCCIFFFFFFQKIKVQKDMEMSAGSIV